MGSLSPKAPPSQDQVHFLNRNDDELGLWLVKQAGFEWGLTSNRLHFLFPFPRTLYPREPQDHLVALFSNSLKCHLLKKLSLTATSKIASHHVITLPSFDFVVPYYIVLYTCCFCLFAGYPPSSQ